MVIGRNEGEQPNFLLKYTDYDEIGDSLKGMLEVIDKTLGVERKSRKKDLER